MSMWDTRYATEEYIFGVEPNAFLRQHADRIAAGGRVLCIGEGEGRNAVFLAKSGFQVTAIDLSSVGLAKARALASHAGVELKTEVVDLAQFDFGQAAWDGIVSIFCHLPSAIRTPVHARVARALAPGGVFILQAYTQGQLRCGTGGPSDPDMLYGQDMLRRDLEGLLIETIDEVMTTLHEGSAHDGLSSVVQLVARRA